MERGSISTRPSKDVVYEYIEPPHSHQNYAVIELLMILLHLELLKRTWNSEPINVFLDLIFFLDYPLAFIPKRVGSIFETKTLFVLLNWVSNCSERYHFRDYSW